MGAFWHAMFLLINVDTYIHSTHKQTTIGQMVLSSFINNLCSLHCLQPSTSAENQTSPFPKISIIFAMSGSGDLSAPYYKFVWKNYSRLSDTRSLCHPGRPTWETRFEQLTGLWAYPRLESKPTSLTRQFVYQPKLLSVQAQQYAPLPFKV